MTINAKQVFLKPNKERALINRHPWIFAGAIDKLDDDIEVGDIVVVKDSHARPLALGHWCQRMGLVIRLLSFNVDDKLDHDFYERRFREAFLLRKRFNLPNHDTTSYRLIHGEGDGLSGLVCDVFGKIACIKVENPGLLNVVDHLADFLTKQCGVSSVFYRERRDEHGRFLIGDQGREIFLEQGLRFIADIEHGQKTGHFLDQRDNRALVKKYALKRRVLDTFSYSGGFSVYALAGGAESVTSVDISSDAISLCQENVGLNQGGKHEAVVADCFSHLRSLRRDEFDVIVLDPPAFAKTAQAVTKAARGYKDINLLALKAVASDGLVFTFSCSQHVDMTLFKKIVFAAAKDANRDVKIVHELDQGVDHPTSIYCPQSSYLKGLVLYVGN